VHIKHARRKTLYYSYLQKKEVLPNKSALQKNRKNKYNRKHMTEMRKELNNPSSRTIYVYQHKLLHNCAEIS